MIEASTSQTLYRNTLKAIRVKAVGSKTNLWLQLNLRTRVETTARESHRLNASPLPLDLSFLRKKQISSSRILIYKQDK